ncbi:MAG: c-type cytochrome [Polyangiales bacterium]
MTQVDWNPGKVDVGKVAAIADAGSELAVFGDKGASSFVGSAFVATDASIKSWRAAATIPAPDGNGNWLVAIDGEGKLRRLRGRTELEDISGRWGLSQTKVLDVASMGLGRIVFALDKGAAISDGDRVARFDLPFTAVAGGAGRGVGLDGSHVRAFRPTHDSDDTWTLEGARFVAMSGDGRMFAANDRAVYAEDASGILRRLFVAKTEIHGLCASDGRTWFADGTELGVIERDRVAVTSGAKIEPGAQLSASPTGDVWTLAAGTLRRYGTVRAATLWDDTIAPIHARVCAGCHGPDGSAGVDLSTAARWDGKRAAIAKRVVEEKSMPPPGTAITDADRAAISAWAKAQ